ncbi:radical SAM protein [Streptomyces sp. SID3343]|uniref:radical SAM protein n=1 Tax=Streptomyces sp. SID3343 TaxID=2690260 RepID=UPI00136BA393|nr:radical SAM protein [Streptomyces sp. SID3343]MYV98354.1 radical SAM protein [Streptomyces sp. SID3343]
MVATTPPTTTAEGFAGFAARRGQLRVSLTPRCQLGCWFCHNEGEIPPRLTHADRTLRPRPRALDADDFVRTIDALTAAGLRRVFFTGGEPLLSPMARPILTALAAAPHRPYATALITNGLRLLDDLPWLAAGAVDRLKVSLHYFSDASIAAIAGGKPGDVDHIRAGIEAAVEVIGQVEINLLLQEHNEHELPQILAYAQDIGVNVQVIELVPTDHNTRVGTARVDSSRLCATLRRRASSERLVTAGTGQAKREFRLGRITVDVIDAALGRHHVGQCATCPVKPACVEGFWSLRLDSAGTLMPCLLRPDLRLDITPHLNDPTALTAAASRHIDAFAAGLL